MVWTAVVITAVVLIIAAVVWVEFRGKTSGRRPAETDTRLNYDVLKAQQQSTRNQSYNG